MSPVTRTIFSVGDEKQSIYSFIGADPSGFDRMRTYFEGRVRAASQNFEYVPLTLSFRSTAAVLDAVDAVFSHAEARDGLTAREEGITHIAQRAAEPGLVTLWPVVEWQGGEEKDAWQAPLDSKSANSPTSLLAARLSDLIAGWLSPDSMEVLASEGRPIRPGDILILVRRRNAFMDEMIAALKRRGLPVAGADRMVLTDQLAIMDLIALARFTLLPQDDLNLASLLKSPLVGLNEEQLFTLAHNRRGSLLDALRARNTEDADFARAHHFLSNAASRADVVPPFEFFSHILESDGGRKNIAAVLGAHALEAVDEFLNQTLAYERTGVPSLQGFLHWFAAGNPEVKRDLDHGRDEIRVMTAHGAKGLEAPIVILPDTCQLPEGRKDDLLFAWQADEEATPFVLWRSPGVRNDELARSAREETRKAREAEYRRLLYVAMTRARDRLYICGYTGKRGLAQSSWYALARKALSARGVPVSSAFGETFEMTSGKTRTHALKSSPVKQLPALPLWLSQPVPAEAETPRFVVPSKPVPFALALDEDAAGAAQSPLQDINSSAALRGQLIHRLLELLPGLAEDARATAAKRLLKNAAYGLDEHTIEDIAESVLAVLRNQHFSALFAPGSRAEVMLAGHLDLGENRRIEIAGRVDRLIVRAEDVLIVDYKSNRPIPQNPSQIPPAYITQLGLYRALLQHMFPGKRITCALLWVQAPLLMPVPDAMLDAALVPAS